LDEAYTLFKQWYLYAGVGFSSFFEIRPKLAYVVLIQYGTHFKTLNQQEMKTTIKFHNYKLIY
jgi:hypothetical protein